MAGSTKTITLKFTGDIDDLVAKVAEADGALDLLNKNAGKTDGFDKLAKDSEKAAQDTTAAWSGTATLWTTIITGALALGAPLVAGAAVALGVAAVGAVGVALVKGSDDVKNSWHDLTQTLIQQGEQSASVMVGPVSTALNDLSTLVVQERPNFDTLFANVAKDIPTLTQGLEGLINSAMPGIVSAFQNSQPILEGVNSVLQAVGGVVGNVFQSIANDAPQIKADLDGLAPTLTNLGNILSNLITIGSSIGGVLNPPLQGLSTLLSDVTNILSGGANNKGYDYNNPIFGTGGMVGTIKGAFRDTGTAAAEAQKPIDDMFNTITNLAGAAGTTTVSISGLTTDITALNTSTTSAKQSAQAFVDILVSFGQSGQEQVNSFVAAATLDLDNMATSFKKTSGAALNADGSINEFTKTGAELQKQMEGAQTDIGSVAGAMRQAGASSDDITKKIGDLDKTLETNLIKTLKLTKSQADALITQFGLWPDQLNTKIGIIDNASPLVKSIGGLVNNLPDHKINVGADTAAAARAITDISSQIYGIPNGTFAIFGNTVPARNAMDDVINAYNGRNITFNVGAAVNAASQALISGITGKRATGGPVSRGASYLIGENGPEVFTPSSNGSITSNSDTANGTWAGGSSGAPAGDIIIQIGNETIARITQDEIRRSNRQLSKRVRAGAGAK